MATIKYLLKGKSDTTSIYLRLSLGRGNDYMKKTGFNIAKTQWSNSKAQPKQTNPDNRNIATDLKALENFIYNKVNEANLSNEILNSSWLGFQIDLFFNRVHETKQSDFVLDLIQNLIDNAHTINNSKGGIGLSKSRIQAYKRLKTLFSEFQKNKNIRLIQLNSMLLNEFRSWLLTDNNYSSVYSNKKIADLRVVCRNANSRGLPLPIDFYSFKLGEIKTYDDDEDVVYLNKNEIERIEEVDLKSEALINARKWLVIACYIGQRGQDLLKVSDSKVFQKKEDGNLVIDITQFKGNKKVSIPVHPKVEEIYRNGLPYKVSTQKLNKYFKKICELAEINDLTVGKLYDSKTKRKVKGTRPKFMYITTHTGRRSFATNYYQDAPTSLIMSVTGHTKESTFLKYINKSDESHITPMMNIFKKEQKNKPKLKVLKKA
jgi:integrase